MFMKANDDLTPYIGVVKKTKDKKENKIEQKDLIMVDCRTIAEQICEVLHKDILTYTKNQEDDIENKNEIKSSSNTTKLRGILRYLEDNFKIEFLSVI